jgi:hypothetical protein
MSVPRPRRDDDLRRALAAILLFTALAGCSSKNIDPPPGAANSARASAEAKSAVFGAIGEPVKVGKLTVTVTNPVVGGDQRGGWLTVTVAIATAATPKTPASIRDCFAPATRRVRAAHKPTRASTPVAIFLPNQPTAEHSIC